MPIEIALEDERVVVNDQQRNGIIRRGDVFQIAAASKAFELAGRHAEGNAIRYPTITCKSTKVEAMGENTFDVIDDLTILATTKPVTLATIIHKAADHPMRNVPTIGVSASAKVMRSEWGLGACVPAVSDEVELSIEVELLSR